MSDKSTASPETPEQQAEEKSSESWVTKGVDRPVLIKDDLSSQLAELTGGEVKGRTWDDLSDEEKEFHRERGFYYGNWETGEAPIRKLNDAEYKIWGSAVYYATEFLSAFRPSIAIMSPFRDRTAGTVYTFEDARVGLGDMFFYKWSRRQQATAVLHEAMHVLYNHFKRFRKLSPTPDQMMNIAGDFEINGALGLVTKTDISMGVHPTDKINVAPEHPWSPLNGKPMWGNSMSVGKTMEQYYLMLEAEINENGGGDGQGDGQGSPGGQCPVHGDHGDGGEHEHGDGAPGNNCSCQGWSCGNPTEEQEQAANEAEVKGASPVEKENARANTKQNIVEERKKTTSYGSGASDAFLSMVMNNLKDSKVPWQSYFRRIIASSVNSIITGKSDYSHRRSNRRMANSRFIFPGMVDYVPKVVLGIDTSGSMSVPDYRAVLQEAEVIIKTATKGGGGLTVFSVDTEVENIQKVSSIEKINLHGGGGTDMSVAFKHVNDLPIKERPDLFVLATDGGLNWSPVERELERKEAKGYKAIILVTNKSCFDAVTSKMRRLATIIDVSSEDTEVW